MKNNLRSFVLGAGLAFSSLFFAGNAISQTVHKDFIDGQIWFQLKADKVVQYTISEDGKVKPNLNKMKLSSMPYLRDVFKKHSITNLSQPFPKAYGSDELMRTYLLNFADINNVDAFIAEMEESGNVVYAEKVPLMEISLTPNDPLHNSSNMWGLFQINAEQAWNVSLGSSSIVVAVADNTVEIAHTDLTNAIWTNTGEIPGNNIDDDNNGFIDDVNGWDAGGNSAANNPDGNINVPSSAWDHGTHCAGTVGAESNNNNGVSSIGFGVSIMPIKCTHDQASSTAVTNGYDGIYYAAINNADVISCSWGGTGFSTTGQNVVNFANSSGSIVVAAAGNSNVDNDVTPHYPSSYANAMSVASTTTGDVKSSFSNYGLNSVDISAPGSNILSTVPFNNYSFKSGTSMATPMVSGLLGLMKSLNPAMPNSALINCLYSTAVNINSQNPSHANELGNGRIDALAAMNCVAATLNSAPVAQFSANITTITAGGSVTFTDQSTFGPTNWAWNFNNLNLNPGSVIPATANTQGPHIVQYNTPGLYEVSLFVSNGNGNDTETKTAYINVTTPGACNQINLDDPSFSGPTTGFHVGWNPTLYTATSGGYVSGNNFRSDKAKVEYFPSALVGSNTQFVEGVYVWIGNKSHSNANTTVNVNLYNATGGSPTGAPMATRTVAMGDINPFTIYFWRFNTPVQVPASSEIAVGIDFSNLNLNAGDTLSIVTSANGNPTNSTGFEQLTSNVWQPYSTGWNGITTLSHYIFPQLTASPATAVLSSIPTSPITICEGDIVNYDATGSTYQDTLLWSFPGVTPSSSNNVMDSVVYNTSGTYRTYLEVVGGGCSTYAIDSVDIVVNPTPTPTVTSTADTVCSGNAVNIFATGGGTYLWTPSNQTTPAINVNPTSTTTYNVAVTTGGCTGNASKTIYVENAPSAAATFTPSGTICTGSIVNFDGSTSNGAASYNWSFPAGSPSAGSSTSPFPAISFGTGGTHNYSLQVTNTCGNNTFNGTVTVTQGPNVVASANPGTTICQGDQVTISANGATTYNWDNSLGAGASHVVSPTGNTTYIVTGDDGTCTSNDTITITVTICTGVDDLAKNKLSIFPNPTNNIVNVSGLENAQQLTLLDVTGKVVYNNTSISTNNITIDISAASKGLYFLQIKTDSGIESYKIVKQ
ncbi:MAG: S8 family serine peptidase [Vicingaceae bacterium]|nr:S8 family serine peptidase [Vicingaceae bacterium]